MKPGYQFQFHSSLARKAFIYCLVLYYVILRQDFSSNVLFRLLRIYYCDIVLLVNKQ